MNLFLIRHAAAEEPGPGGDDAARALTPRGRERFALEVRGLRALGVAFEVVYHSPLLRARETAELLRPLCRGELAATPLLAEEPGTELLSLLGSRGPAAAAVGHEPWLSELCAWLVAGERPLGPAFAFKKGGAAELDGECAPGGMRLMAHLPPRVLRALGGG